MPLPRSALVFDSRELGRCMLLADVHVGYEVELMARGVKIPYQTERIIDHVLDLYDKERCEAIVLLGDVKHEIPVAHESYREVKRFLEGLSGHAQSVVLIAGNHDGGIDKIVQRACLKNVHLFDSRGVLLTRSDGDAKVLFTHGNVKPRLEDLARASTIVMGHTHPALALRDETGFVTVQPVIVKMKVDKIELIKNMYGMSDEEISKVCDATSNTMSIVVLPTSNPLTTGVNIVQILTSGISRVHTILNYVRPLSIANDIEIYLEDLTYIGSLRTLIELDELSRHTISEDQIDWNML